MEVHHHSHTQRKKWTHYFWEFLMLFLAVFCGFLAEYKLEHVIEQKREKQFIKSLIEDPDFDLLSYDYKELNAYASRITHQRASMVTYVNIFIPGQKRRASELIALLKNEYHLK